MGIGTRSLCSGYADTAANWYWNWNSGINWYWNSGINWYWNSGIDWYYWNTGSNYPRPNYPRSN
jgi:hypothetical protein